MLPDPQKERRIQIITKDFKEHWTQPWTLEKVKKMMSLLLEHSEGKLLVKSYKFSNNEQEGLTLELSDAEEEALFFHSVYEFFFHKRYWRLTDDGGLTFNLRYPNEDTYMMGPTKDKLRDRLRTYQEMEKEKEIVSGQTSTLIEQENLEQGLSTLTLLKDNPEQDGKENS